ncbi:MAG: FAD-dependent oxidoreductase [Bryobacterales bacterium]|nr:FAD-dependent oxidoreductase [Bryobacterales bacterium]
MPYLRCFLLCLIATFFRGYAQERPDLIVTGAGIAGLSAALEGARAGLKVTVIEQNSVFGGHAVISSGGLSLVGTPLQERMKIADSPELAERDFRTWGEDPNEDWVRYYSHNSRTGVHDWLAALGVEFVGVSQGSAGNSVPRFHGPRNQGLGLVLPLYRELLRLGCVTFLWNTRVVGLLSENGRVTGVFLLQLRTGVKSRLEGGTVLLSTGGFAMDLDLVRATWPRSMRVPERVLVGGGFFATGSGMDLSKAAGGAASRLDHQWNYASGLPDPFDPDGKRGFFTMASGAIWVNTEGKRFVLEQHEPKSTVPVVAAQPGGHFWAIFDSAGRMGFRVVHSGFTLERVEELFEVPGFIRSAGTLDELARETGLPPATLTATVERYNRMVEAGEDSDFGRFGPNVRSPEFTPPPRKIAQPPFYAAPMYILVRKSMGGITVDAACRVLNNAGKPVPGLLAAGEATGFGGINGKSGLEGTFLGPSILMGRVAAQTVVAERKPAPPAPSIAVLRTTPPAVNPAQAAACKSCHNLPAMIAQGRPGYWHFEQVHRLVASRDLNCTGCHAEMAPFRADSHRIDPQLQTSICQHCHVNPPRPNRRPR